MGNELIKVVNISKSYGAQVVLKDIDLSIKARTAICLLGHNGSGKSTLLNIIAGIINPSSGNVVYQNKLKMNYVPDRFPKLDMAVHQFITHMGMIEGVEKEILAQRSLELYEKFFITNMLETKLKNLSKGSLQKIAIIQALLTTPDVLLMDEPISGQDLDSQHCFIQIVNELKQRGTAIVMCCHEKILVDYIADESYEINNGIMTKRRNQENPQATYATLHLSSNGANDSIIEEIRHLLVEAMRENNRFTLKVKKEYADDVLLFLLKKKWTLLEMNVEEKKHEIHI